MKILAIRGRNLASLEGEFELDFTAEPLKSAGIFAITGSTGSGKSTLLDAICLALFNQTPRISRAENADIADVKKIYIKQTDSRSILRRGTAEGYAEVDFVALSGDKHRARWSVRRARNKIDGQLQNHDYKVWNLSTGSELQGTRTELLQQVKELIGLSFDQFTRAVLLAQGDFASFLKAGPREKAELLEKLTGTEIYSRISAKIYERNKDAEAELSKISNSISDIELLSDEQCSELGSEQVATTKEIEHLEGDLNSLKAKSKWIEDHEQLKKEIAAAIEEKEKCTSAIEQAQPRFDYLKRVDSVQEIRDTYKLFESTSKQVLEIESALKEQKRIAESNKEKLGEAKQKLGEAKLAKELADREWERIEPLLKEARRLDTQIENALRNLAKSQADLKKSQQTEADCAKSIKDASHKLQTNEKSLRQIDSWFETQHPYSSIIPSIDAIVKEIDDAQSIAKERIASEKLCKQTNDMKVGEEKQLAKLADEAQRLNEILPSEIALLRQKLIANEPCPVCGSTTHPIGYKQVESLAEKELNEAKERVRIEIERLSKSIDNRKEMIARLQSAIERALEQFDRALAWLDERLSPLADWQSKYEAQTLGKELNAIAQEWKIKTESQSKLSNEATILSDLLVKERTRMEELGSDTLEKSKSLKDVETELDELQRKRKEILEGQQADEQELAIKNRLRTCNTLVETINSSLVELQSKSEITAGSMSQLERNLKAGREQIEQLEIELNRWLAKRPDRLRTEELATLLSNDSAWLYAERKALEELKEKKLTATTTLAERERVAATHQSDPNKPAETESLESLSQEQQAKSSLVKAKRERISEIAALFAMHQKGLERIEKFKKELDEKRQIAETWGKLNELLGSADGAKFKVMAQGYTLDVLLSYANKQLQDLTERYRLERVSPDSLSLQVIDLDMLSEVRSVHSLSGGESFLVSLALALGLSSLSSNRMRIESLFIDEGFGSLDADTLRVALDALERLQTQGRKIGVISHVSEMTEKIPTQIRIVKTSQGSSRVEVAG